MKYKKIFSSRSDTDSGRSSDYRSDDNSLQKKLATMEEEPVKYFSLPRPKYNRNPEVKVPEPVELPKVKLRVNADNFRQRRVGGRRFTVDVSSTDVDTALADVGLHRQLSRSISTLNKPLYDEMKLKAQPQLKKESIMEEDESERPKGPEFIVNSVSEIKVLDISDNKVKSFNFTFATFLQFQNLSVHDERNRQRFAIERAKLQHRLQPACDQHSFSA